MSERPTEQERAQAATREIMTLSPIEQLRHIEAAANPLEAAQRILATPGVTLVADDKRKSVIARYATELPNGVTTVVNIDVRDVMFAGGRVQRYVHETTADWEKRFVPVPGMIGEVRSIVTGSYYPAEDGFNVEFPKEHGGRTFVPFMRCGCPGSLDLPESPTMYRLYIGEEGWRPPPLPVSRISLAPAAMTDTVNLKLPE